MSDGLKSLITLLIVAGLIVAGVYIFKSVRQEYREVKEEVKGAMEQKAKADVVKDLVGDVASAMKALPGK